MVVISLVSYSNVGICSSSQENLFHWCFSFAGRFVGQTRQSATSIHYSSSHSIGHSNQQCFPSGMRQLTFFLVFGQTDSMGKQPSGNLYSANLLNPKAPFVDVARKYGALMSLSSVAFVKLC